MQRDQKLYLSFMLNSKFVMILRSQSCKVAYVIAHFLSALPHFLPIIYSQRGKRERGRLYDLPQLHEICEDGPSSHTEHGHYKSFSAVCHSPHILEVKLASQISILYVNIAFNFHSSPSMLKDRYAPKNLLLNPGYGEH